MSTSEAEPGLSQPSEVEQGQNTIADEVLTSQIKNEQKRDLDELSSFRQQWQSEFFASCSQTKKEAKTTEEENLENAMYLFMNGSDHESNGRLYEAVRCYKQAVNLVPDIEFKIYEKFKNKVKDDPKMLHRKNSTEEESINKNDGSKKDLYSRIKKQMAKSPLICYPEFEVQGGHISWLPLELINMILSYVVGPNLDIYSLEQVTGVCRGFFLAASAPEIWHMICRKVWHSSCGELKNSGYKTWREMFIHRPRVQFNGCYISRTTYARPGEHSFQDQFYRPWFEIVYFRYLRFFGDGKCIMLTCNDEPPQIVPHFKKGNTKLNIIHGDYQLIGDRVIVDLKKCTEMEKTSLTTNSRNRPRKKEPVQQHYSVQSFHMEFKLVEKALRKCDLKWTAYNVSVTYCGQTSCSVDYDVSSNKHPVFRFYRVKSYDITTDVLMT